MAAQYLRNNGYHTSAAVIADEAGIKLTDQNARRTQLKQLRRDILDADWEMAVHNIVKLTTSRSQQRRCLYPPVAPSPSIHAPPVPPPRYPVGRADTLTHHTRTAEQVRGRPTK